MAASEVKRNWINLLGKSVDSEETESLSHQRRKSANQQLQWSSSKNAELSVSATPCSFPVGLNQTTTARARTRFPRAVQPRSTVGCTIWCDLTRLGAGLQAIELCRSVLARTRDPFPYRSLDRSRQQRRAACSVKMSCSGSCR